MANEAAPVQLGQSGPECLPGLGWIRWRAELQPVQQQHGFAAGEAQAAGPRNAQARLPLLDGPGQGLQPLGFSLEHRQQFGAVGFGEELLPIGQGQPPGAVDAASTHR
ncbi:MAG: hypothetical protein EBW30_04795 [Synechococcaceae bacterium WB7_3xG_012]|nr:hypothetical protein [Synechococcaceae bacterium WB7_3xG_012]